MFDLTEQCGATNEPVVFSSQLSALRLRRAAALGIYLWPLSPQRDPPAAQGFQTELRSPASSWIHQS
uniref:Uncharacterized protein n=1 Tax=uncultured marine virus TaxID=186617 RepID=A0A0F7L3A9_9VIRU|nr:hypothetical protein [uncultured marine virus]